MEHTAENHLSNRQKKRLDQNYKNRFYTTIAGSEISETEEIGDSWINKRDHELLKDHLQDCYFWYVVGSCNPFQTNTIGGHAVDGYEIHIMTNKKLKFPWKKV